MKNNGLIDRKINKIVWVQLDNKAIKVLSHIIRDKGQGHLIEIIKDNQIEGIRGKDQGLHHMIEDKGDIEEDQILGTGIIKDQDIHLETNINIDHHQVHTVNHRIVEIIDEGESNLSFN